MCSRCDDLQAEVTELRRQLAYEVDLSKVHTLRRALFITPQQATILSVLYDAKGRPVNAGHLLDLLPVISGDRIDTNIINVQICKLRKALGDSAIETYRITGYRLTTDCQAKIDDVLAREAMT